MLLFGFDSDAFRWDSLKCRRLSKHPWGFQLGFFQFSSFPVFQFSSFPVFQFEISFWVMVSEILTGFFWGAEVCLALNGLDAFYLFCFRLVYQGFFLPSLLFGHFFGFGLVLAFLTMSNYVFLLFLCFSVSLFLCFFLSLFLSLFLLLLAWRRVLTSLACECVSIPGTDSSTLVTGQRHRNGPPNSAIRQCCASPPPQQRHGNPSWQSPPSPSHQFRLGRSEPRKSIRRRLHDANIRIGRLIRSPLKWTRI